MHLKEQSRSPRSDHRTGREAESAQLGGLSSHFGIWNVQELGAPPARSGWDPSNLVLIFGKEGR